MVNPGSVDEEKALPTEPLASCFIVETLLPGVEPMSWCTRNRSTSSVGIHVILMMLFIALSFYVLRRGKIAWAVPSLSLLFNILFLFGFSGFLLVLVRRGCLSSVKSS